MYIILYFVKCSLHVCTVIQVYYDTICNNIHLRKFLERISLQSIYIYCCMFLCKQVFFVCLQSDTFSFEITTVLRFQRHYKEGDVVFLMFVKWFWKWCTNKLKIKDFTLKCFEWMYLHEKFCVCSVFLQNAKRFFYIFYLEIRVLSTK